MHSIRRVSEIRRARHRLSDTRKGTLIRWHLGGALKIKEGAMWKPAWGEHVRERKGQVQRWRGEGGVGCPRTGLAQRSRVTQASR